MAIKFITEQGYIDMRQVFSCRPVVAYLRTGRGLGKTTWCAVTSIKHCKRNPGEFLIYIRMYKDQITEAKNAWFKATNCKLSGISPDECRINGKFGEIKLHGKWYKCVRFVQLSAKRNARSSDDPMAWCAVFDEGDVTLSEARRYRGDYADDLADLHDSLRRETSLPMIIFSNKESASNRILDYHGIKNPPEYWNGCRRYKHGTFLFISTDETGPDQKSAVQDFKACYSGTKYGKFRFEGAAHSGNKAPTRRKPYGGYKYAQFAFSGLPAVSLWRCGDYMYVCRGIDVQNKRYIFVDKPSHDYPGAIVYKRQDLKNKFQMLQRLYIRSMVFADDISVAEVWDEIAKRLGL